LEKSVNEEVQRAADQALSAAIPAADSYIQHVYSAVLDPTSSAFETKPHYEPAAETNLRSGMEKTMADLINTCMRDEMARDPRIIVIGEDIADSSR